LLLQARLLLQVEIGRQQDSRNKEMMLGSVHCHAWMAHQLNSEFIGLCDIGAQALLLNPTAWILRMTRVANEVAIQAVGIGPLRLIANCAFQLRLIRQVGDICAAD